MMKIIQVGGTISESQSVANALQYRLTKIVGQCFLHADGIIELSDQSDRKNICSLDICLPPDRCVV